MALAEAASCTPETWAGLACHRLQLVNGDCVRVAEHGAQVLSWCSGGRERLFLSERAVLDGRAPIRGGVPLCWPQFNQRGPLPKHGFARQCRWHAGPVRVGSDAVELDLQLHHDERTLAQWPVRFKAMVTVRLAPGQLRIVLQLENPGTEPFAFTGALHSYLAVDDVAQARLHGLDGQAEGDAVADVHAQAAPALMFAGEFDRVYAAPPAALELVDGPHRLRISQSPDWADVVVWNPGAAKGDALADMAPGAWRHMLCVEAAQVFQPIVLDAGAVWQGWQAFTLA